MNTVLSSAILRIVRNPFTSLNKGYFVFVFAFVLLMLAVIFFFDHSKKISRFTSEVHHSQEVISAFQSLSNDTKSAQMLSSELGRHHANALNLYLSIDVRRIPKDIQLLKALLSDHPQQRARLDTILNIFTAHLQWMNRPEVRTSKDSLSSLAHVKSLILLQRNISKAIEQERQLLGERQVNYEKSGRRLKFFAALLGVISLGLFISMSVANLVETRKRASVESFLETVVKTSQNAITVWEAIRENDQIVNFRSIFVSEAVERNGPFKVDDMIGRLLTEVSPDAIGRGTFAIYKRVTETGVKEFFESAYERNRVTRWLNASVAKLGDGFIVTFSDITDLKNSQRELQEKVELLEHTNSELEQFAYVASHDLQEPLRKIKTFASLINERFNEPSAAFAKVYLNKVIDSANRMSGLISDLLSLSYISERGRSFSMVNLNEVIKNVMNDFELTVAEANAVITTDDLPTIEAIPSQMNQLFYNMIGNALKYKKENEGPEIVLSCYDVSKQELAALSLNGQSKYYRISVKDNGIGFDPQFSKKIFVIFQRLNNRDRFAGTGIGLALCRKIVLNHHGEIYADSKENEGSTFHVILPQFQNETKQHES